MNIYALLPLAATIAYIPLLGTAASSRPWQRRQVLFIYFLIAAMMWSLVDYLFRSNFFPEHNLLLLQLIIIVFPLMCALFHLFVSSFYGPGRGRWLPLAYSTPVIVVAAVALGLVPEGVTAVGDRLYPQYGLGTVAIFLPLAAMLARSTYVLVSRLKGLDNPVLHNQIISLLLGIHTLTVFTLAAMLPWGREIPISHLGNLLNATILSYATIRHQLVDVRTVLRRGLGWATLAVVGIAIYWGLLYVTHALFEFELSMAATVAATAVAIIVAIMIYRLRDSLFTLISRGFQGQSYDYRQELAYFANTIHNVFSLKAQGGKLLLLITKAIGCKYCCLLFPAALGRAFTVQLAEPKGKGNPLSVLTLPENHPVAAYLNREQKPLTRENLSILPEFRSLWGQERDEFCRQEIELFLPLISREKLTAILVLSRKQSGRYSLEDINLLENVTNNVAVSMEKEYLREQLREREEELELLNRSSAIISSHLNIKEIYGGFIGELKKLMDIGWAAILMIEENDISVMALSSEVDSLWQVGERLPLTGSATEWVAGHKQTLLLPDLSQETAFPETQYLLKQGMFSGACLPLMVEDKVIGGLWVASPQKNAFSQRHLALLEQLSSQITMSVANARLYAQAEEQAMVDSLTGLFNRRLLDETMASEIGRHSRYGGIFSLVILDLDSFKSYNDNYGHLAGDQLLRQVGLTLKNTIRKADQAYRFGGDEFAILLPQTDAGAAQQVAERVRRRIAEKVKTGKIPVTASLGLATWPADGILVDEVIARADMALYHAKRSGGNRCHHWSDEIAPTGNTGNSADGSVALSSIYNLAATVDARDHYTSQHSMSVIKYAQVLAEGLNLAPLERNRLENCALLHDIGKIGITDDILNKQSGLTEAEWAVIKTHPKLGADIVRQSHQLASCVDGILYHHEKWDGSGYPAGLKGEEIPLEARILAIADAFAAMTSDRPYAEALPRDKALAELRRAAGTQFDPSLVTLFCEAMQTPAPVTPTKSL